MKKRILGWTFSLTIVVSVILASPANAGPNEDFDSVAEDDQLKVIAEEGQGNTVNDQPGSTSDASIENSAADLEDDYFACLVRWTDDPGAAEDAPAWEVTEDGQRRVENCPEDGPSAEEIAAAVNSAFRTLHLSPSPITYQPEGTWALVNMDFIVYTDPAVQTLDSEVFGIPITIRATPVHYLWDFDDGSTISTTDPGRPYPEQTVAHVYTSTADAVAVSLTTSFQGEFTYEGADGWLPIAGLATTTSTADPVEIVAIDVNLVPND
jgi:hypothetical protein